MIEKKKKKASRHLHSEGESTKHNIQNTHSLVHPYIWAVTVSLDVCSSFVCYKAVCLRCKLQLWMDQDTVVQLSQGSAGSQVKVCLPETENSKWHNHMQGVQKRNHLHLLNKSRTITCNFGKKYKIQHYKIH